MKNQKHLRLFAVAMLFIAFTVFISGCWDSRELNKLAIVSGIGLDIEPETGEHLVAYQSIIPSKVKSSTAGSSGEQSGGAGISPAVQLDHIKGNTWLETLGNYATQGNRNLFFPHNQVVVFGKELAREGVYPPIELILRYTESRPNWLLLVSQDKASDIISARNGMEVIPAMGIAGDVKSSALFSKYPAISVLEFSNRLMSKTTAPILPIISMFEETGPDGKRFNKVRITGTAVFKGDQMVGELNEQESRGMLWAIDKIKKGLVVADAPDGSGKASFGITQAKSKIIPELTDGKITINVVIEEQSTLAEYNGRKNLDNILLKQLEERQAEKIKSDIMAAINKSITLNTDIFGFGEAVHRKYKKEWLELEGSWDEIYPGLDVVIKVKTHLNDTGDIRKAVIPQ